MRTERSNWAAFARVDWMFIEIQLSTNTVAWMEPGMNVPYGSQMQGLLELLSPCVAITVQHIVLIVWCKLHETQTRCQPSCQTTFNKCSPPQPKRNKKSYIHLCLFSSCFLSVLLRSVLQSCWACACRQDITSTYLVDSVIHNVLYADCMAYISRSKACLGTWTKHARNHQQQDFATNKAMT